MGLMLSILVVCVGVIEALSCYEHFQYGVLHCATNIYENARRRSSVFLNYTSKKLKLLSEDLIIENNENCDKNSAKSVKLLDDTADDSRKIKKNIELEQELKTSDATKKSKRKNRSVPRLKKEDKIEIVKKLLEKPTIHYKRPRTIRSISMPEIIYTQKDIELSKIINELVIEPIEENDVELEVEETDFEFLVKEYDNLFDESVMSLKIGVSNAKNNCKNTENPELFEKRNLFTKIIKDVEPENSAIQKNENKILKGEKIKNESFLLETTNVHDRVENYNDVETYQEERANESDLFRKTKKTSLLEKSKSLDFNTITSEFNKSTSVNIKVSSKLIDKAINMLLEFSPSKKPSEIISQNKPSFFDELLASNESENITYENEMVATASDEIIDKNFQEIYENLEDESSNVSVLKYDEIEKMICEASNDETIMNQENKYINKEISNYIENEKEEFKVHEKVPNTSDGKYKSEIIFFENYEKPLNEKYLEAFQEFANRIVSVCFEDIKKQSEIRSLKLNTSVKVEDFEIISILENFKEKPAHTMTHKVVENTIVNENIFFEEAFSNNINDIEFYAVTDSDNSLQTELLEKKDQHIIFKHNEKENLDEANEDFLKKKSPKIANELEREVKENVNVSPTIKCLEEKKWENSEYLKNAVAINEKRISEKKHINNEIVECFENEDFKVYKEGEIVKNPKFKSEMTFYKNKENFPDKRYLKIVKEFADRMVKICFKEIKYFKLEHMKNINTTCVKEEIMGLLENSIPTETTNNILNERYVTCGITGKSGTDFVEDLNALSHNNVVEPVEEYFDEKEKFLTNNSTETESKKIIEIPQSSSVDNIDKMKLELHTKSEKVDTTENGINVLKNNNLEKKTNFPKDSENKHDLYVFPKDNLPLKNENLIVLESKNTKEPEAKKKLEILTPLDWKLEVEQKLPQTLFRDAEFKVEAKEVMNSYSNYYIEEQVIPLQFKANVIKDNSENKDISDISKKSKNALTKSSNNLENNGTKTEGEIKQTATSLQSTNYEKLDPVTVSKENQDDILSLDQFKNSVNSPYFEPSSSAFDKKTIEVVNSTMDTNNVEGNLIPFYSNVESQKELSNELDCLNVIKENKQTNSAPEAFWLIFSGEYTKAMSKDWHSGHFSCWQCDEALTGQRYVLRDDHPYCIKCYESVFANVCEECNKIIGIDSKDLSYKDKHWHEACFLCNKCRVSLVDKQFGSKADKIYCGNCYDAQFASRCDGCGEIFRAGTKKMEYKTRQWHEKCFCCCVCKTPIGTKSFIPREQEIYCATCYEEKFATRCVKCNKIITSGGVTYKNEPWHRECFTCTNCNTSLAGQRFTSRDEKPYCADCFGELFAKRCTACSRPITGIGGTRFISFEDRHWHNDCFICASCKTSLVGRGFITDGDDIICPECAKQKLM